MEDLLHEQEFAEIHHNPWKSFRLFYRIAVVQSILFGVSIALKFHVNNEISFWIAFFVIPMITTIAMFRFPKKNIQESPKVKLLGILGLTIAYAVPCMITAIFIGYDMRGRFIYKNMLIIFTAGLVIYSIVFGVCSFVVFIISSFRDRRKY